LRLRLEVNLRLKPRFLRVTFGAARH